MNNIFSKIKFFALLSILLYLPLWGVGEGLHAQTTISGKVTDKAFGDEIIGASIRETDATGRIVSATVTNISGEFTLDIKSKKNKLQVTYIGFKPYKTAIGNSTVFNIKMEDENSTLDEVVVKSKRRNGGDGFNISEREISTAVGKLDMAEIEGISMTSAEDALQGRISGLDIVGGGAPGSGSQMRIRGTSTIMGNAQPLVVVNGVPFSGNIDIDLGTATEEEYADLLNVNVDDIQEITVLKDAASTAMWGSKGANGVLLITTKRGSRGKTKLSYSYKLSGQTQPKGMDMLSGADYTMLMKQEFYNRRLTANESYADYSFDELNYNYKGFAQAYNYDKNTDWVDAVTKHGYTHDHYLTLSGGGERANYRVSAGYYDRTGTNLNQEYKRYSSRLQLDYFISQRIRVSAETQLTYSDNDKNYTSLLDIAYKKMPNMSIYEYDKYGELTGRYFNITPGQGIGNTSGKFDSNQRNLYNPVALGELATNNVKGYRVLPRIELQYDIFDPEQCYLRLNSWVSIDMNHENTEKYLPAEVVFDAVNSYSTANQAYNQTSDKRTVSTENSLTWQSRFKNPEVHNLQAQLKMQTSTSISKTQLIQSYGLPSSSITDPTAEANRQNVQNANSNDKSIGWMARLHYVLYGRYIFDANVRVDGSTQFGSANRYGTFPGFSAKWIISDEPFIQKLLGENGQKILTMLAFRPSWGVSGRQPGKNYLQYSTLTPASQGYMDISAIYPTRIRLDGLKWEKVTSMNWGADMELFESRISINADMYHKRTNDLLFSNLSIPSSSGFSTLTYKNVGILDNDGWELTVNFNKIIQVGKFSLDATVNFASNKNNIVELDEGVKNQYNNTTSFGNGVYATRLQEGNSFGSIYGFKYKGVYAYSLEKLAQATADGSTCAVARDAEGNVLMNSDGTVKPIYYYYNSTKYQFQGGDAIYEDLNNDGSIDQYDVQYLGNCNPKLTGGFGMTFKYDRLSLSLFSNFRYGNKIINAARMNAENMYYAYNQCSTVNWRWRKEGDVTDVPRAVYQQGYNWLGSDRYVKDGSFLRMKYVTLRYAVPTKTAKKLGMSSLNAYFTMTNLFCLTNYSGADPEISSSTATGVVTDNSTTPRSKDWTLGISLSF